MEPDGAARRLLLALQCLVRWEGMRLQDQELPLLLQLLLFGGPATAVDGVIECIDLVSVEQDASLNRQLLQGEDELLIAREVQPMESLQQAGSRYGEAAPEGTGGGDGRAVKQEPL